MSTDIVSIAALRFATTIGLDHWQRARPQPIQLSVHLHLAPLYLDTPGRSDDVKDSLHYGHLSKAVERRVGSKAEGYATARALVEDVTDAVFSFVRDAGAEASGGPAVRVILSLPKQILLAGGFEVELTTRASQWMENVTRSNVGSRPGATVRVSDLILPVLIGVNPPERLARQRVITDVTFIEVPHTSIHDVFREVDYPTIVQRIATDIERSSYLTLEKLVYEIIQTANRALDAQSNSNSDVVICPIATITVRCRKPSALSFGDASEVEMTRAREMD